MGTVADSDDFKAAIRELQRLRVRVALGWRDQRLAFASVVLDFLVAVLLDWESNDSERRSSELLRVVNPGAENVMPRPLEHMARAIATKGGA